MVVETISNGKVVYREKYYNESDIEKEAKKMIKRYLQRKIRKVKNAILECVSFVVIIGIFLAMLTVVGTLAEFLV